MEKTANLQQATEAAKSSDQALNVAWNSLSPATRKQLLAQQRIWIKQKDASCKVRGLQSSSDASEQKIAEVLCKAELSSQRATQLQGYYQEDYSGEETESY